MYEECCFECSLIINNLIGLLQFIMGICEIVVLFIIEIDNKIVYYFVFFKSTINIVYGCMLFIYSLYCFKSKNNIIKFTSYYNYIIGIWGFFEWIFAKNLNDYYLNILFLEFMIFQFKSSILLIELCIHFYFRQNIMIINNFDNSFISVSPIININNDNISLVEVINNDTNINNSEDDIQHISYAQATPVKIIVESYKFEDIDLT